MSPSLFGHLMPTGAALGASERQAQRAGSGEAAGLVPFKTTADSSAVGLVINLAPSAVAERRVNRLKRSVWASGHLHGLAENGSRPAKCWFVTLTYRPGIEWASDHLSKAVKGFRNWCAARRVPCRYTWVAELQHRGAVHYHLLAWLPVGVRMPKWDRRTATNRGAERLAFWPHGMTNVQIAKAGVGYLMKYLSKLGELMRFPKGLRLYGIGGLNETGKSVRRWYNLPEWVKRTCGVGECAKVGNSFVVRSTGEILEPAFAVQRMPFGLILRALRELPARFHDGAYSSVSFV